MRWIIGGAMMAATMLAGCNERSASNQTAQRAQAVSRADPRLPGGFPIYLGSAGQVRAFEVMETRQGGKIATFSVQAEPKDVIAFYETAARNAGLSYAGRFETDAQASYEARRTSGDARPRTFGATAQRKSEWANVTLMFDVTR